MNKAYFNSFMASSEDNVVGTLCLKFSFIDKRYGSFKMKL